MTTALIETFHGSNNESHGFHTSTVNHNNNHLQNLQLKIVTKGRENLPAFISSPTSKGNKETREAVTVRNNNNNQLMAPNLGQQRTITDVISENAQRQQLSKPAANIFESAPYYEPESAVHHLAGMVESALRSAKKVLECRELLIPRNLTLQISQDIVSMAETEPCGLKGCVLYVDFEEKSCPQTSKRISVVELDKSTVTTFEMYLTLRRDSIGWLSTVSTKLFKNFGKDSIVISELYKLSKKKLYRSLSSP